MSQALLDSWAGQGKLDLKGNVMTLLQGEGKGRSYALEPAVRFLKVLGSEEDPLKLLAKVKTLSQLRDQGAELVENSVIVGEVAYEVEPGFLAETAALQAASAAGRSQSPPAKTVPSPAAAKAPPQMGPAVSSRSVPRPVSVAPAAPAPAQVAPVPAAKAPTPAPTPESAGSAPALPRELEEKREEAEALARYLLEFLSR